MYFINLVYLLLYKWCKAIKCSISGSLLIKGRTTFKKNYVHPFTNLHFFFYNFYINLLKMCFTLLYYSNFLKQLNLCLLNIINVLTYLNLIFEQIRGVREAGVFSFFLTRNINDVESR